MAGPSSVPQLAQKEIYLGEDIHKNVEVVGSIHRHILALYCSIKYFTGLNSICTHA